jgi:ribonuclease BN (tRNA processing enzyme)
MANSNLFVRFWGVRGSYPVPGPSTLRYGGNTSCVEIRAKNHLIIIDAGTGIINLGNLLLKEIGARKNPQSPFYITLLFSHTHNDHIQGLPFFAPAYLPHCILNIFGPRSFSENLDNILGRSMQPQNNPVELEELAAQLNIQNLTENQVLILNSNKEEPSVAPKNGAKIQAGSDVLVKLMRSYAHPKIGVFVFRIEVNGKSVVYATDTEGYVGHDTRLIEYSKNADLLIHDAQYDPQEYLDPAFPKQGFGHSTYEMAAQVAMAANVKHLVLFHHDPLHDDHKLAEIEAQTRKLFPNSTVGAEGLEFTF